MSTLLHLQTAETTFNVIPGYWKTGRSIETT